MAAENRRRQTGIWGEDQAEAFLRRQGLSIVARGFRCRFGEIDIIAREADCLIFCEVRTRREGSLALPQETVSRAKQRRLIQTAGWYLGQQDWSGGVRFDVLAVTPRSGCSRNAEIEWFIAAFDWH